VTVVAVAALAGATLPLRPDRSGREGVDWAAAAGVVSDHREWGVRALVKGTDDALAEVWSPVRPQRPGLVPPASDARATRSDTVLLPTGGGPVAALGVTSPDDQPVIDLRVWRIVDRTSIRIENHDLPGDAPGVQRLLVPPAGMSLGGAWPPGGYGLDLLVGSRVLSLFLVLPAARRDSGVLSRVAQQAGLLAPGPFSVAAGRAAGELALTHVDVTAGVPLAEGVAWLQLVPGIEEPLMATLMGAEPIRALGVRGAPGEQLISAILFNLSPHVTNRTTSVAVMHLENGDVGLFDPAAGTIAPGVYRIDSSWQTGDYFLARSWHLDIRAPDAPADLEPPLLAAARQWAGHAGTWAVLTTDGGVYPQLPGSAAAGLEAPGDSCSGGPTLAAGQHVIGIGHETPRAQRVSVERLLPEGGREPAPVAISIDPAPGLVLLAPRTTPAIEQGSYLVTVDRNEGIDTIVFCVAP
jgi:hypothetical protein